MTGSRRSWISSVPARIFPCQVGSCHTQSLISDDMPHLCAAESAGCAVFVTGDKELQALDPIGAMRVLSPRDFREMFEVSLS